MNATPREVGKNLGWDRQETDLLFQSQWYDLRQDRVLLPNGQTITYTYMDHPGAALLVPVTQGGKLVLLNTYRYPIDDWCWCVPGGGLGDKPGMTPEEVAREELAEEAGCVAASVESLGEYHSVVGVARLKIHYFLGRDVRFVSAPMPEAAEVIGPVRAFSIPEVYDLIYQQRKMETESAFAILLALHRLGEAACG
jgi:ADP-ribose pyrophosphatase